jgi:serine/threonine protein kinase
MPSDNEIERSSSLSSAATASTAPTEVSPASASSGPTVPAASSLDPTVLPRPEGLIGQTLDGRYFVEKEMGHGGVGVVYLARDRRLMDKCVVVKVLLERWLQDEWIVNKFLHEKEALARVDHPGIVGILDAGELADGKPFIVMQCVEGVTLRSVLRPEGMSLGHAARIIGQVADALGAAHEKGILHRDLKPENIMLHLLGGGGEQAKIIDFGIAKVRGSMVAPSTVVSATVGTIAYMSPEQLGAEPLTPASDIFALGAIAYEMLTGRRPFNPDSQYKMLEAQHAGVRVRPQDLRPAISAEAEAVILKALSFDPRDRYQDAREFGRALAEALTGVAQTARFRSEVVAAKIPPEVQSPPAPAAPRFRRWATLALALLVVAVVGTVVWRASRTTDNQQSRQHATPPALTSAEKSLTYSLLVRKKNRPDEELSEFAGQEIFEDGDGFRFNASSPRTGYLYLFNKSARDGTNTGAHAFTILYPTPKQKAGSAQLAANEPVQTSWNTFSGGAGTEQFWIVWATEPVDALEAVKEDAFSHNGVVTDTAQKLREFLAKHAAQKTETIKDPEKKLTTIQGEGAVLVDLVNLEHR